MSLGDKYNFAIELFGYQPEDITWATLKKDRALVNKNAGKLNVSVYAKTVGNDTVVIKVNEVIVKEHPVSVVE